MEKFGDIYLDFNQNDNQIEDLNLNAVWVDLDKGSTIVISLNLIKRIFQISVFSLKVYCRIILDYNLSLLLN